MQKSLKMHFKSYHFENMDFVQELFSKRIIYIKHTCLNIEAKHLNI